MNLRPTSSQSAADTESTAQQLVDLIGARVHIDILIPGTNIRGKMRLCSRREVSEARAEARQALRDNGFPVDASAVASLGGGDEWTYELAIRLMQRAVRDPSNPDVCLAPIEDWRECTDNQVAALAKQYEDLEALLDPLGENDAVITDAEYSAIIAAAKKKERELLMSYGSHKLASFIRILVNRLASSETPKS